MQLEENPTPKRSSTIKAEIRGHERNLSDAAQRGDTFDYAKALNALNAAKLELRGVEAREHAATAQAAKIEREQARFKEATGFNSVGELIADDLLNGGTQRKARIAHAERTQAIAEAMLKPKPTPADLNAEALARITKHNAAIKADNAQTPLQRAFQEAMTDIGDDAA